MKLIAALVSTVGFVVAAVWILVLLQGESFKWKVAERRYRKASEDYAPVAEEKAKRLAAYREANKEAMLKAKAELEAGKARVREEAARKSDAGGAIKVHVTFENGRVNVENLDDYDWQNCTIYLNGIAFGYRYEAGRIGSGRGLSIPLEEFATRGGKRFNPYARKPTELVVWEKGRDGRIFKF